METSPVIKIIEQPARCALRYFRYDHPRTDHVCHRFRYECEGRSAGSIPGASSTPENKTFPAIQVINYNGPYVVVVSCVTKDQPFRAHPHNLVGKEGCKKGVCTIVVENPDMVCSFTSLGIQCVKRKDVEESLKLRESIKVDPFRTGFSHKNQASNIDLNVVRLCFQVFIEGPEKKKFTVPLSPVVCEPIYDKKAMSELTITKLSHCSGPVGGGKEVILLCDRVTKDDVQVRFYEERNGHLIWEALGDFQPNDVHKQVAICFRTPRYYDENIQQPIVVQIQLRRPSDAQVSDSRPFQLIPRETDSDVEGLSRKRQKVEEASLDRYLRDGLLLSRLSEVPSSSLGTDFVRVPRFTKVKTESEIPSWNYTAKVQEGFSYGHEFAQPKTQSDFKEPEIRNRPTLKTETIPPGNPVERVLTDRLDSLDLDIDPSDLISDINFNNLMVMMDSGNNITFNSSGNITTDPPSAENNTLNTPQILDISESSRNPLATHVEQISSEMQYMNDSSIN